MNPIVDEVVNLWQSGRKTHRTPAGWISGNAVCCHHRGERPDSKGRGGIRLTQNQGIIYACFNCGFKTGYIPGSFLGYKFRKLLSWLGAEYNDIDRLIIESLRIRETVSPDDISNVIELPEFTEQSLPKESRSFWELVDFHLLSNRPYEQQLIDAVKYIHDRKISMQDYDFYISHSKQAKMDSRVIIPFYWGDKIVGYSARLMIDGEPKYYTQSPTNYVFNVNNQRRDSKFVIVSEGPFDAMSVDGVAILGNQVSDEKADIIDSLNREVIVVADADAAGKELIKFALEYGWTVSFPAWRETSKDINEAVQKYGRLYTLKSILSAKETNALKIKLRLKGLNFS